MTREQFRKSVLLLSLLVCALFAQISYLHAQQLATLSVTVTDPTGSVVPGAQVSLNNANTGIVRTQTVDSAGSAVLTALIAGDYQLSVKANAFSERSQL